MVKRRAEVAPEQPPVVESDGKGKTDYNVPAEVFIATWQTSASAMEVSERLKMPKDIVHARASTYRQAGIRLKKMPRHQTKALDVDKMNAIIDEIDRQAGNQVPKAPPKKSQEPVIPEDVRSIVQKVLAEKEEGKKNSSSHSFNGEDRSKKTGS